MGLNWGFENFRNLVPNASQYNISFETVSVNFLRILVEGLAFLGCLGVEQFPNIIDWSQDAPRPFAVAELPRGITNDVGALEGDSAVGGQNWCFVDECSSGQVQNFEGGHTGEQDP